MTRRFALKDASAERRARARPVTALAVKMTRKSALKDASAERAAHVRPVTALAVKMTRRFALKDATAEKHARARPVTALAVKVPAAPKHPRAAATAAVTTADVLPANAPADNRTAELIPVMPTNSVLS
ncbi:hypothetical protein HDU85_004222 [Gaertneriomyces sp. JEL0708]|nr:hypothetical protein HDU85_004222 [Gaertneriomyces sp. JEL0708]